MECMVHADSCTSSLREVAGWRLAPHLSAASRQAGARVPSISSPHTHTQPARCSAGMGLKKKFGGSPTRGDSDGAGQSLLGDDRDRNSSLYSTPRHSTGDQPLSCTAWANAQANKLCISWPRPLPDLALARLNFRIFWPAELAWMINTCNANLRN
jgi:hypothetical protein